MRNKTRIEKLQEQISTAWWQEEDLEKRESIKELLSLLIYLGQRIESLEPELITADDLKDAGWNAGPADYSSEIQSSIKDSDYIDKRLETSREEESKRLIGKWDREDKRSRERDKLAEELVDLILSESAMYTPAVVIIANQLKVKFYASKE